MGIKKKLHLGCGYTKLDGYINIDIRPEVSPDVVCDISKGLPFEDNSIDEVYFRHVLEHFTKEDGILVLKNIYRVLKIGSVLNIVVPDIMFHAKQLIGMEKSSFSDQYAHAMAGFYGWEGDAVGAEYAKHLWGWDENSLIDVLNNIGFSRINRMRQGKDSEKWHLNICAVK